MIEPSRKYKDAESIPLARARANLRRCLGTSSPSTANLRRCLFAFYHYRGATMPLVISSILYRT
jgi:hypothetical protein